MTKRDRRESDNWKSKVYHLRLETYRNYPFNWLGRDWSWGDWHWSCGCLNRRRGRLIRRWCFNRRHRRTDGGYLVNTSLVCTCSLKCQITLATFYKATMCTVSITFTMLSTTISRLDGRRYSRRVSFTRPLRCHVLRYFISNTCV